MRLLCKKTFIRIAFLLVFLTAPNYNSCFGNTHPATHAYTLDKAKWEQLTNDKAFSYKNDRELQTEPVQKEEKPNFFLKMITAFFDFFINSNAGKVLLWLIVLTVAIYIVYILLTNKSILFSKNKKVMSGEAPVSVDEDFITANWELQLKEAMKNNDLRLAVRYSFMWLLQVLQKNQLIQYRDDKTNYEYYTELNASAFKQPFKQLSRQYEYVWYGRFTLSPEDYQQYINTFNNIKNQLNG